MSFKENDNHQNMIHLGNYEEYFILYMDNELDTAGRKMVEEFLLQHPDLQAEFEMLMSTQLPLEDLSMDKSQLHASAMKESVVDEELLLYIDNELTGARKEKVELELAASKVYFQQHQLLLRTRLDAGETIMYPDKQELYRKEEKRGLIFRPWMRVAAAAVMIAAMGVVYMNSKTDTPAGAGTVAVTNKPGKTDQQTPQHAVEKKNNSLMTETAKNEQSPSSKSVDRSAGKSINMPALQQDVRKNILQDEQEAEEVVAVTETPRASRTAIIESGSLADAVAINTVPNSEIINTSPVTSVLASRKTDESAAETDQDRDVAKGSFKGFLRKATRMIEKKTGIDPTNDGELLIGAVAINLK